MPNMLVHIAVQTLLTRGLSKRPEWFAWALAGCLIPDLPWILQRIVSAGFPDSNLYALRSFVTVQATLLFSVLASAAVALFFRKPGPAFAVISAGCLLHLLLDGSEIKWGNGVHLIAPASWQQWNWGVVWPDQTIVTVCSIAGVIAFCFFALRVRRSAPVACQLSSRRALLVALLSAAYLAGPIVLLDGPGQGNSHFLDVLEQVEARAGKPIELDRVQVQVRDRGASATTYAGETLYLAGAVPASSGSYSLKGQFTDSRTILVSDSHRHDGHRDLFSYVGLSLILAWFLRELFRSRARLLRLRVGQ